MVLLVPFATCAVGCASSSSSTPVSEGYSADGSVGAAPTATATGFAPTGPAIHSSAASQAADVLTAVAKPGNSAYKIGPLDVLDIQVFKVPDLTKTVQVSEMGDFSFPLVGDVRAVGRTARDLERDLAQRLGGKYLRDPQVTILVKEFNSQRVTVSGAVKTSGVYAIKGATSLMQVIAMAGDVDTSVDSGDIVVFRTIGGTRSAAKFDVDDIKSGKAEDPQVEPGDVVVVNSSATKVALSNVLKALPIATTAAVFSGL